MSPDLDAALCRDFPKLYVDRNAPMEHTSMCWGFPGDGWEPIIRKLSEKLEPLGVIASQVKEKFGTLRFYIKHSLPTSEYNLAIDLIAEAEAESDTTCEKCGKHEYKKHYK